MDWNERFQEAIALADKGQRAEADEIFEEVADATMNSVAVKVAVSSKMVMFYIHESLLMSGVPVAKNIIDETEKTRYWIDLLLNQTEPSDEERSELLKNKSRCLELKGKCLYMLGDAECVQTLQDAISLGSNQAKLYLALVLKDHARDLANSIDASKITNADAQRVMSIQSDVMNYYGSMVSLLNEYVRDYDSAGSSPDELKTACTILSVAYQNGLGVEKDNSIADYYQNMADKIESSN